MSNDITAVILAGGIGKRFVPFTTDKPLFSFMGKTLIHRTLEMIDFAGVTKVIIATNAQNHTEIEHIAAQFPRLEVITHQQAAPKGMADALLSLTGILPSSSIVVMNAGDMVDRSLLAELLDTIKNQYAIVTGMEVTEYQPLGYFELDGDRVVSVHEKPGAQNMPSNLANLVFHYFSQPEAFIELLEHFSSQASPDQDDVYEQALSEVMQTKSVGIFKYAGSWQKLKFGHHVLDMTEYFLNQIETQSIHHTAQIAESATITGPVLIDSGAKIMDNAIIKGPAYIGKNVLIGDAALVRGSSVEEGATIGFASEIVRSYIGKKSDLHHVYIGDSVLEESVHFGFNAHTANYRFDHQPIPVKLANTTDKVETNRTKLGSLIGKNTEVGVNASLMPGITIGSSATIYPQAVVYSPVPDNAVLKITQSQTIEEK